VVVVFEDEFSLSNTATISYDWSPRGVQPLAVCKQRRRERQTVMGSYNIATGQITASFHQRGNYKSLKKHLKKLLHTYRGHSQIIIVLDNVRFHHAKLLKIWLQGKPQIELVYLPPYSPELNPIERAWWYMRKSITHNRYVLSMSDRKKAFWKMFSHFQKPNEELMKVCEINY
jgi:transposase